MFCGMILIHRVITYLPTYSGFKYENLILTNVILAFLVIVLSIQTKLGIKVNILVDRLGELWNGPTYSKDRKNGVKNSVRVSAPMSQHMPSQADYLDNSATQSGMFPPAPVATTKTSSPTVTNLALHSFLDLELRNPPTRWFRTNHSILNSKVGLESKQKAEVKLALMCESSPC